MTSIVNLYCHYRLSYDTKRDMIQCDHCKQRYHQVCEKIKNLEKVTMKSWHYSLCKQYSYIREKYFFTRYVMRIQNLWQLDSLVQIESQSGNWRLTIEICHEFFLQKFKLISNVNKCCTICEMLTMLFQFDIIILNIIFDGRKLLTLTYQAC